MAKGDKFYFENYVACAALAHNAAAYLVECLDGSATVSAGEGNFEPILAGSKVKGGISALRIKGLKLRFQDQAAFVVSCEIPVEYHGFRFVRLILNG